VGKKREIQRYVAQAMEAAGGRVRTFDASAVPEFFTHLVCFGPGRDYSNRPTVVGELGPSDAPALLIAAHSDTVPIFEPLKWSRDPFDAHVENGRVYGLGAGDDKMGVALMLILMRQLQNQTLRKRLIFVSTIDEEHGVGNGLLLLHLAGIQAEAALYLDGCDLNFYLGHLGGSGIQLKPKVAMSPEVLETDASALEAACKAMSKERESLFERPFLHEHEFKTRSATFVRMRHVERPYLDIRFYTVEGEEPAAVQAELENMIARTLGTRVARYNIHVEQPWFEPAFTDPGTPFVQSMAAAYRQVTGEEPSLQRGAKQDAFVLTNHAGIPTLSFGVSRSQPPGAYHMPDEFIEIEMAGQALQIVHGAVQS
jgi:acetylornithine deacetylase